MSQQPKTLSEARARVAASRERLFAGVQNVGDQFNVPKRIRTEMSSHPVKWTALGIGASLLAIKALPPLLRLLARPVGSALAKPLLATTATTLLPIAAQFLGRKLGLTPAPQPPEPPVWRPVEVIQ